MRISDIFLFLKYYLNGENNKIIKIYSSEETIEAIISKGFSVARFGDGEFDLMLKINHPKFQNNNKKLTNKLLETFNTTNKKMLVCIPKVFDDEDLLYLNSRAAKHWKRFIWKNIDKMIKIINKQRIYGNALFTRHYIDLKNKDKAEIESYFNKIKQIWREKEIVVIEGRFTRFGIGNDLLNETKSVKRILCPETDAFDRYDDIFHTCLNLKKEVLFLIALGPTATVLANDLCAAGYQAIDIGHLDIEYEWFLKHADDKCAIANKYVNESGDTINQDNDNFHDEEYKQSIIARIY